MTFEEFCASRRPVSDEVWGAILETVGGETPRDAFFAYGEAGREVVLHEIDGGFFPHAWWRAPGRKESRAEAERVLFAWSAEFS